MNKLYLTAAVLSVLVAPQAMAQTMMSASGEVKSEVPEYDVLDKSKLQSKVGLSAGLSTGNELVSDNQQRYGNDLVGGTIDDANVSANGMMQNQTQAQSQTTGQMQANVPMQQPMQMQQPTAPQQMPMQAQQGMMVQTPSQPAAPQVTMQQPMAVQQPAQPMVTSVDMGTQVNVETYAVGNTDTGVNMDQVQRLLANK